MDAAERLFAERGIHQATTRDIVAAAGQRNASALTYHFGSRGGVLRDILVRHGDALDAERGELVGAESSAATTRDLVGALLVPYARCLETHSGRNYLRIVVQLSADFPQWRVADELRPPNLRRILTALEQRVPAEAAVGRERVVGAIMLMTVAMADRARRIEAGEALELNSDRFLATLVDMLVAGLDAAESRPAAVPTR